ncbi:MAG: acyl-CoA/acyl-ACP dehydrogenase [Proteobacteria bacterium]|nr:acyl-CoA/acyl-ACP dehydrogenase [Pseudomonadota bacterium]
MEFGFTSEQEMLRKSFAEFLSKECPTDLVKEMAKDEVGFSPSLWKKMAELGWLGLTYDDKYGGMESSFLDLFILFEEIGKVLLPSPLFTSAVLSGMLINEAGEDRLKDDILPQIVEGKKILTLALLDELGQFDTDEPKIEAVKNQDNQYLVSGTRMLVPFAQAADEIIVCARVQDSETEGPTLIRIDGKSGGLKSTYLDTLTEEKTYVVAFDKVKVPVENLIGEVGRGHSHLNAMLPKATVLKCGEMLGGLQRVVDMSVDYVKERHQFGRPLGSLQAVQHHCADMATYLETTRLIAYQAAYLLSEGHPCESEVSMAKAWASEAYRKATWIGQQIQGGIGFTEEWDMHLYYKHAKASELAFGSAWDHRAKVAENMGL